MNNNIKFKTCLIYLVLPLLIAFSSGCASTSVYKLDGQSDTSQSVLNNLKQQADNSANYETLVKYGYAAWFLKNDYNSAREYWLRSLEKNNKPIEANVGLAFIERNLGHNELSQRYFLKAFQLDPSGPYAELCIALLYSDNEDNSMFYDEIAVPLEDMINQPGLSIKVHNYLVQILLKLAEYQGDLAKYKKLENSFGHIGKYSIVGPFGQFSTIDYSNIYEPEKDWKVKPEYIYNNIAIKRYDVNYDVAAISPDSLFDNDGVTYNVSYIKTDEEKDVVFSITNSPNCSLYVDNVKVLEINSVDYFPMGDHYGTVHLSPGWHKVLLKFGDPNRINQSLIFANNTDGTKPFSDIRSNLDNLENVALPTDTKVVKDPQSNTDFWQKQTETTPDFYNMFFLLQTRRFTGDYIAFKQVAEKMLKINSNFAYLYIMIGFVITDDPTMPQELMADQSRQMILKALELDENNVLARMFMAAYYKETDQTENAFTELRLLKQKAPDFYAVDHLLFGIYRHKGWLKEQYDSIASALSKNPNSSELLADAYSFYLSRMEYGKALKYAEEIQKRDRTGTTMALWYKKKGQYEKAIQQYEEAIKWQPNKLNNQLYLASLYQEIGQYPKAYELIEDVVKKLQSEDYYYRSIANLKHLMGDEQAAVALLNAVLDKKKSYFSLRRSLKFLENKAMLDEYVTDGMEAIKKFEQDSWKPESSVTSILDECIYKTFEDGSRITRVHMIDQVNTREILSQWGEIHLRNNAEYYTLRAIKPDGRIIMPEYIDGKNNPSIPNLEVGDYIEQDYVIGNGMDTRLTGGRMYIDRFFFTNTRPTFNSKVTIIRPQSRNINIMELNYNLNKAEEEIKDGLVIRKYRNEKIEQLIPEPMMPVIEEVRAMIHMDEDVQWEEIRDLFRQRLVQYRRTTPELEQFAHEITKGIDNEYDKTKAVFYAVTQLIDGENKDFDLSNYASHILALKEGNRLLLISTLLKILEIDNEYILVKPQNVKEINYRSGNTELYYNPLLRVRLKDGKNLYLEANFKESVFNEPSPINLGTKAMVLNGEELFTTLPTKTSTYENKELSLSVNVQPDGSALCEGVEKIHGFYSVQLRKYLKMIPQEKINQFFEMVLNKAYPGITLIDAEMGNLYDASKPVILHYRFQIGRYARQVEDKLRLPSTLFKVDLSKNFIKVHDRQHPLLVNSVTNGYNIAKIQFPAEYTVNRSPAGQVIENEFGVYRFTVNESDNSIEFIRAYTIPIQKIGLDKYMEFYKFCSEVDQLERQDLTLIRKQ